MRTRKEFYVCGFLFLFLCLVSALTDAEVSLISRRQLTFLPGNGDLQGKFDFTVNLGFLEFLNPRIRRAYIALQALKNAIHSDPFNSTGNWVGPDVCQYTGVFCSPAIDNDRIDVVSGIDLNHFNMAGYLPVEIGLLTDISLFHINSNRFCGILPDSFSRLVLLYELDLSNNRFVGPFPEVVIKLPSLKFLDIRFNDFEGQLPPELFRKNLDALFLNDNRFTSLIPENLGDSPASVIVFANNQLGGCIPRSIGKMRKTLQEIVMRNNRLQGCLPPEIGFLESVTVFDTGFNLLTGTLPQTFSGLKSVEVFDVSRNSLIGSMPATLCNLPDLKNLTFSYNYFNSEAPDCLINKRSKVSFDDKNNCLPAKRNQKSPIDCYPVVNRRIDCGVYGLTQATFPVSLPPVPEALSPKLQLSPILAPVPAVSLYSPVATPVLSPQPSPVSPLNASSPSPVLVMSPYSPVVISPQNPPSPVLAPFREPQLNSPLAQPPTTVPVELSPSPTNSPPLPIQSTPPPPPLQPPIQSSSPPPLRSPLLTSPPVKSLVPAPPQVKPPSFPPPVNSLLVSKYSYV